MISRLKTLILAALCAGVFGAPAHALIYGIDYNGGTERLVTIDPGTGAQTVVGNLGISNVSSLAFDTNSGTLWAAKFSSDQLLSINTITGAATVAHSLSHRVVGLSFNPATGLLFGEDALNDNQLLIDPVAGTTVALGSNGHFEEALAYDPLGGTLYGTTLSDNLVSINPATGATSVISGLGMGASGPVTGLAYDFFTGTLFGYESGSGNLISINTGTGFVDSTIGPVGGSITGMTYAPDEEPEPGALPEPGPLLIFGLGLAAMSVIRRRRKI